MKCLASFILIIVLCNSIHLAHANSEQLEAVEAAFNSQNIADLRELAEELSGFDGFIAQYRLATQHQLDRQPELAKAVVKKLIDSLEAYIASYPEEADPKALLANAYGYAIFLDSSFAAEYGPESHKLMAQALAAAPNSPLVLYLKGNLDYNTPTMYGGSKVKAKKSLTKAIAAYQRAEDAERSWGYADALVLMGLTELEQGDLSAARGFWMQALEITQGHAWASYLLELHKT